MKINYLIYTVVLTTMVLISCNNASQTPDFTYIKSDKSSVEISVKGDSGIVVLNCDGDGYEVLHSPEWMTVSLTDSILKYNVAASESGKVRKRYLVVGCDTLNCVIPITQATRASYLFVPQDVVNIDKSGKGSSIKVITNGGDIKVDCPKGVEYTYSNGILSFSSKGHSGSNRTTKAKVICDDLSTSITIKEKGDKCASCNGTGTKVCYICGGSGVDYCPYRECDICGGRGRVRCKTCGGSGK